MNWSILELYSVLGSSEYRFPAQSWRCSQGNGRIAMPGSLAACSPLLHLHTIGRAVKTSDCLIESFTAKGGGEMEIYEYEWIWVNMSMRYDAMPMVWFRFGSFLYVFGCQNSSNLDQGRRFMVIASQDHVFKFNVCPGEFYIRSNQPLWVELWTNQPNEPADIHWQNNHHLEVQSRVNGSEGHLVVAASGTMSNMHKNIQKQRERIDILSMEW